MVRYVPMGECVAGSANAMRVYIALTGLTVGALVYLIDRPGGLLGAHALGTVLSGGDGRLFGAVGNNLPAFMHAFAFSLLTGSALPDRRSAHVAGCAGWALVDLTFELLQHPALFQRVGPHLEPLGEYSRLTRIVSDYFRNGVFDAVDMACIVLGAALAYATLSITRRYQEVG